MAFKPPKKPVQFADLINTLAQARDTDSATYQTIKVLIDRLGQFQSAVSSEIAGIGGNAGNIGPISGEGGGTGGGGGGGPVVGGMNLDYLGSYVSGPVYNDGDIVVGPDGISYMCVVDGTITPPEPWPQDSGAFVPLHHINHELGGIDPIKLDALNPADDTVKLDSSATRHGLLPKLSNKIRDVFSGIGTFAAYGVNIPSGTVAQQPTGLTAADAGLLYMVMSPYNHLCRWDGTAWRFAPGDCGNGYFSHRAIAPQEPGWLLCNGGAGDYLVMGGASITVAAFTTPNLAGVYLKGAVAYSGAVLGAVAPVISGAIAAGGAHGHTGSTDAQGSHGHTFTSNGVGDHNHSGETNALGTHSHGFGIHRLFGTGENKDGNMNVDAGASGAMSRGPHYHDVGIDHDGTTSDNGFHSHTVNLLPAGAHSHTGSTDAAGSHAHGITATAVGDHTHGIGTLGVSGSAEPLHIDVLVYFRR